MDKKDIYEHLAKIYLDSTSLKKKKSKTRSADYKQFLLIAASVILGILVLFSVFPLRHKFSSSRLALVLSHDTVKINFRFDPAKKEIYYWTLNKLNLNNYKTLGFVLKKSNFSGAISLKVEFANRYKEKGEVYLKDIPNKWQEYKIAFSDFKAISDWSEMESLAFVVEEWNTKEASGIIYIDNVRLIK
jgi:hypothetical protein